MDRTYPESKPVLDGQVIKNLRHTVKRIRPTFDQKRWERMVAPLGDLDVLMNPLARLVSM